MSIARELGYELDATWIIALWKAIHGGDPGPEGRLTEQEAVSIARHAAGALIGYISAVATGEMETASAGAIQQAVARLKTAAIELVAFEAPSPRPPRQYCFRWQGRTICVPLPSARRQVGQ